MHGRREPASGHNEDLGRLNEFRLLHRAPLADRDLRSANVTIDGAVGAEPRIRLRRGSREVEWFRRHPTRIKPPAEITYKLRPASWATRRGSVIVNQLRALAAEVGAEIDGAYWVDDVKAAGKGDVTGFIDLKSHGLSRRRAATTPITTIGADGPSPHLLTGVEVAFRKRGVADKLSGRLSNISALRIDVGRAGLSDSPALDIETDREVTITFMRDSVVVGAETLGG